MELNKEIEHVVAEIKALENYLVQHSKSQQHIAGASAVNAEKRGDLRKKFIGHIAEGSLANQGSMSSQVLMLSAHSDESTNIERQQEVILSKIKKLLESYREIRKNATALDKCIGNIKRVIGEQANLAKGANFIDKEKQEIRENLAEIVSHKAISKSAEDAAHAELKTAVAPDSIEEARSKNDATLKKIARIQAKLNAPEMKLKDKHQAREKLSAQLNSLTQSTTVYTTAMEQYKASLTEIDKIIKKISKLEKRNSMLEAHIKESEEQMLAKESELVALNESKNTYKSKIKLHSKSANEVLSNDQNAALNPKDIEAKLKSLKAEYGNLAKRGSTADAVKRNSNAAKTELTTNTVKPSTNVKTSANTPHIHKKRPK